MRKASLFGSIRQFPSESGCHKLSFAPTKLLSFLSPCFIPAKRLILPATTVKAASSINKQHSREFNFLPTALFKISAQR